MNARFRNILLILIGACGFLPAAAQRTDSSIFDLPLQMDEVMITAAREGWDVNAFIRRVKNDTTFYKAFRSLRLAGFSAVNDIRIYSKKGSVAASLYSHTRQVRRRGCRTMQTVDERVTGDFYKANGDYRYYTAALYAYLFFTKGKVCGENDIIAGNRDEQGKGRLEKSKAQLKQLIFNPGSRVSGVPFMGDKASLFDPEVARMYDFRLLSVEYNGDACYLFRALPKKGFEKEVVFNELSTWFRKSDYAIVARDYSLSFRTVVYDFDVRMKVRLQPVEGKLLPSYIEYDGDWRVATQGRERARFTTRFDY